MFHNKSNFLRKMYTFLAPRFLLELQCTVIFIHFYTVLRDNISAQTVFGNVSFDIYEARLCLPSSETGHSF